MLNLWSIETCFLRILSQWLQNIYIGFRVRTNMLNGSALPAEPKIWNMWRYEYPILCFWYTLVNKSCKLISPRKLSYKPSIYEKSTRLRGSAEGLFDVPCGFGGMQTSIPNWCNNSSENSETIRSKGTNINPKSFKMEPWAFRAGSWDQLVPRVALRS